MRKSSNYAKMASAALIMLTLTTGAVAESDTRSEGLLNAFAIQSGGLISPRHVRPRHRPPQRANPRCITYMLDRGYGPEDARETCRGLNYSAFACLQSMMDRGYGPETARDYCQNITTPGAADCFEVMLDRGYDPEDAVDTCHGLTWGEAECIRDMMDRGYSRTSARQTCT